MIQTTRISRRHLPDILHLIVALREDAARQADPRLLAEQFGRLMARRDGGLQVFVAREGRFPVGYLAGSFSTGTVRMAAVFCVHEVFIAKPFRGGATLRALAEEASRYAQAKGAGSMELRLRRTQRELILLAEAMRFEPTGREVFERLFVP